MKTLTRWQNTAAAGFLWLGAGFLSNDARAPRTTEPDGAVRGKPEVAASALVVYLDPVTGRLMPEAPPGEAPLLLRPEELEALSRSDFLLVEEEGPVSGTIVDLEGRFQSISVATVGRDGKVRRLCLGGAGLSAAAPQGSHGH